jgi:alpha-beta hydrolase superfamily lysophospholipase
MKFATGERSGPQAAMEMDVDFTADGFKLRGTLHLPKYPAPPIVIGSHGLLSDRNSPKQVALAQACNRLGLAFFRFDHRGCGESEGRLEEHTTLDSRCSDLMHAIRHLAGRADLCKRVGLFGSSMGGAVCLRVAARADIAALVTFAAPARSRPLKLRARHSEKGPGRARMAAVLRADYDLSSELEKIRNVLVFHGDADDVVPVAHALEIFQRASQPKRLIIQPRGDHLMSDPHHQEVFIREASLWLSNGLS